MFSTPLNDAFAEIQSGRFFMIRWNLHVASATNYPGISGPSLKEVRWP